MTSGSSDGGYIHRPVLLNEVLQILNPGPNRLYVDCTLGGGGHAHAILQLGGETTRFIGLDRDAEAIQHCKRLFKPYRGRVELFRDRYENLAGILAGRMVDGILFDLGVSSLMLDDASRGFSFRLDGPLDMRMDNSEPLTAEEIVNNWDRKELAGIFKNYGEEPFASRIAARIERARAENPITSTLRLAEIVKSAVPYKHSRIHPATRVFMALRIAVNGELERLEQTLEEAVKHLALGGRLAVISYHSLEDRIVKRKFSSLAKDCVCPPALPRCVCGGKSVVKLLTKKPVRPSKDEVKENPRSRSALLRALEKIAA